MSRKKFCATELLFNLALIKIHLSKVNLKLTGKPVEEIVDLSKEFLNFLCLTRAHDEITTTKIERTKKDMIFRFVIQIHVRPRSVPPVTANVLQLLAVFCYCPPLHLSANPQKIASSCCYAGVF